jgi:two-component system, cell cycle response regulator CpdR
MTAFRVLCVDDDNLVREIISEIVPDENRLLVAASSGEEALRAFREHPFDLVVTDVSLPGISGFELVALIRAIHPTVPIILASGYSLDSRLYRLGTNVWGITKPFEVCAPDGLIQNLCLHEPPRAIATLP